MAIIKAGTYRFNDVLTTPELPYDEVIGGYTNIEQWLDFTTTHKLTYSNTDQGVVLTPGQGVQQYVCIQLSSYGMEYRIDSHSYVVVYEDVWLLADPIYPAYSSDDTLIDASKIITIPTDQEVSDEFYDWFKDNTECMLSGTWQLNDAILPPAVNLYVSAPFISNGVIYQRGAVITLGSSSGAVIIYSTEERYDVYEPHTVVVYADGEAKTIFEENYDITIQEGWLDDSYKTVTFAKAGFSGEWYNWFTTNANQVVEDIDYLIKSSTLSSIADSIRIKTGKTNNITPTQMPDEIMSIVGSEGTDTSDATATEDTILLGFTAYNNGVKITGTIETYTGESSKNEIIILSGEEAMF